MFSRKSAKGAITASLLLLLCALPRLSSASLAPGFSYNVGAQPIAVALGDLNNDGNPELITLNENDDVNVLLGVANGGFTTRTTFPGPNPSGFNDPNGNLAVADLNHDGKNDLVVGHRFSAYARLGNGAGGFGAFLEYPSAGALSSEPLDVALGDLNGDGTPDLVDNSISCLGNGDGTFTQVGFGGGVRLADFNGDGKLDRANGSGVSFGNGDGTFGPGGGAITVPGETGSSVVAAGDLNRDGKMDLAVGYAISGHVWVLLGNGDGTFTAPNGPASSTGSVIDIAVADVTCDGILDVLSIDPNLSKLSVYPGDGHGVLGTRADVATGASPRRMIIVDLNGDASNDVIVAANVGGVASVHMNSGEGVVNLVQSYFVPQAGSLASPVEGVDAIKYFRACPNNDGTASLPNNARIKLVLRDQRGNPVAAVPAASLCVAFNGGTPAQEFEGTGADSVIANSAYNPTCPDVRCLEADAASDASGVTYITFTGSSPGSPGVGVRNPGRKWGHYDSNIPVQYLGINLDGRLTSGGANGTYRLIIKNLDFAGGLGTQLNQGESVTITELNAVGATVGHSVSENPLYFWRDFDSSGVVTNADLSMVTNHLNHNCQTPLNP